MITDAALPCVMTSLMSGHVNIGENSVVEYTRMSGGGSCRVGSDSIVSNCHLPAGANVLDHVFVHTCAVKVADGETGPATKYVTVMFGVDDNMKARGDDIRYDGRKLGAASGGGSLWELKLFESAPTMEESFAVTSRRFAAARHRGDGEMKEEVGEGATSRLSMSDVIRTKDVEMMLEFRKTLLDDIEKSVIGSSIMDEFDL